TGGGKAAATPASSSASTFGAGSAKNDDSGLIDLNALAKAQAKPAEAAPAAIAAPSPFLFPAALGNVETFQPTEQKKKSSMPLVIGGVAAVAVIAILVVVMSGGKKDEIPALPAGAALSAAAPMPEPSATAAPAQTPDTPPADSAAGPASAAN